MSLVSRVPPATSVFLDTGPNPTEQIIRTELVSGNVGAESFVLKSSFLSPPVIPMTQLLDTLNIPNSTKSDYGDFVLVFKSVSVAPYTLPQNYAFPASFEILNITKLHELVETEFTELEGEGENGFASTEFTHSELQEIINTELTDFE